MSLRPLIAGFVLAGAFASTARAQSVRHLANGIAASNGSTRMQVTALTDSIVRVRVSRSGSLPEDASWAVPFAVRRESVAVTATPDGFKTKSIALHLDPASLQLSVTDLAGKVISADQSEPFSFDGKVSRYERRCRSMGTSSVLATRPARSIGEAAPLSTGTPTRSGSRRRPIQFTNRFHSSSALTMTVRPTACSSTTAGEAVSTSVIAMQARSRSAHPTVRSIII